MTASSRNTGSAILRLTGALLLASGLVHVAVWWVDGSAWAGPVSFRKPVLFGVSGGLLALSLAWALDALGARLRRSATWWAWLIGIEVALITVQAWRRRVSHFNQDTALDVAIFAAMGGLILAAWAISLWWTWLIERSRTMPSDRRAAALGGLVLLHLASALGVFMSVRGTMVVTAGGAHPALIGQGSLHLPHAVGIHGFQVLLVAWWALRRRGVRARELNRTLGWATVGLVFAFSAALVQVFMGHAPEAPTLPAAILLVIGALSFLPAAFALFGPRLVTPVEVAS
ncbi:MAG: hypothetical protein Q8N26_35495 [Myxococcales bacterium]|nr:hypothetical protein [Myxococcales bacterium]